ncbi:hypothetical protein RclHR1_03350011 [Rhizophagus clarus]|uniref:DUF659 domain-containing protein n=1 Tax=Rhizophagus clarus TaxID=94130 RepID=A0A2Z6R9Z4_9GLOM|nr:hypothetical protein RclHR1_03350011 [Rhizophagus clarus]
MAKVEGTHDNSDTEIKQPNQKRIKLNERHRGICKVEEVVGKECRKTYKIRTSTSNCSDHFANIHGITQEHEEVNVNQNQNIKDAFSKLLIMEKLEKDANAISLTCDLWTGCNRQGFLGITCSYLNPEFQLHEIILSVQYILYPHIADHIGDTLLAVLDEWELQDKTFMITTDNGSNMQKAIKDLELAADNIMPTHYSL